MITERERKELNDLGAKYYLEFVCDPNSNDPILNEGYYAVVRTKDDAIVFDCMSRDMALGYIYGRGIEHDFAEI